ncbi:unnamed protein product [Owenia fusiformis]|uniref:Uncharacterized protein n=1 Tax=Owenia fusiformis TaxID=6347 RepID=A0A8J1UQK5_OWEFU|nr:unnamed protein product [Owenia fusiformis]
MIVPLMMLIVLSLSPSSAKESDGQHTQARYVNVKTVAGLLQGEIVDYPVEYPEGNKNLITVTQFLGVPYAKPPIGDLRWKNPQKVGPWEGVKNATAYGNSCWQNILMPLPTPMSEDCLFLNIWVPGDTMMYNTSRDLAILFWIHGGDFQFGTGSLDITNGAYMAHDQNVIVITINYRLNSFGFLSTESKPDEGNWGLKDCVLALQWVRDNIRSFSGDPNSVTIFGESTGSAIVTLLMLSKQANGLFKRAIGQSGSAFNYWAMNPRGRNRRLQQNLAKNLGCPVYNNSLDCLRNKRPMGILNSTSSIRFAPNVDGTFFHDEPENILEKGDFEPVDFINGVNRHEGFPFASISPDGDNGLVINSSQFNDIISKYMKFLDHLENRDIIQHGVRLLYDDYTVDYDEKSLDRTKGLVNALGDFEIIAGSHKFSTLYQKQSTKTSYCYFLDAKISEYFRYIPYSHERPDWVHTSHADDIQFVFGGVKYTDKTVTREERELSGEMMKTWANFAKTGNPTESGSLHWPEFTGSNYLQLSTPVSSSTVIERFLPKRMDFWINFIWKKVDVPSMKCANNRDKFNEDNCPVCLIEVPRDITYIICKSTNAFKASILTEKIMKIESNLRPVTGVVKLDRYVTYNLDSDCTCDIVTKAARGDKLLILTMATNDSLSSLYFDDQVTVIKLDNKLQRKILRAIKENKCPK